MLVHKKSFRCALKNHLLKILEVKRNYWENRAKTKWANLGGEIKNIPYCGYPKLCTKFIVSLKTEDDRIVTGRDAKVETI